MNFDQWLGDSASGAVRFFSLGRHALAAALRTAGIGPGDGVLLPEFLCRDVLASINAVGAIALWYPVGEDLTPRSDPEAWPDARAVLVVDYFGFPQPLAPFLAYAARTGALVIEDNAHGFLSRDEAGRRLGTRGDFGVFSLRKTVPMVDGAALLVGRRDLTERLPDQIPPSGVGFSPGVAWKSRVRRTPIVGVAAGAAATTVVRALRRMRTGRTIPEPDPDAELAIPYPPAPHPGLESELAELDELREIERRRRLYRQAEAKALATGIAPMFPDLPSYVAPYGFPFRTDAKRAIQSMGRWAVRQGLDLIHWPDLPNGLRNELPLYHHNLWLVNFL